ncbi:hypothetical protein DPMN_168795 [Dreissena polymorpha]|uniref:Uncharacterized protein n=1 Tax=Dreissena polymorpha TaxID=45954 RepID=A0A9D4F3C4_DREPO|nr:hypothetical protein DPMN_168795 [Dreissena polymorpha]
MTEVTDPLYPDRYKLFNYSSAYVAAFCTSDADCPDRDCGHGEVDNCVAVHGGGGGNGEMQCKCVHHGKRGVAIHYCGIQLSISC